MRQLHAKQITLHIGNKTICQHLNLTISSGEIWCILGPNGSGKTTLLHALAGLHPIDSGEIFLAEQNLRQLPIKSVAKSVGFLFQDSNATFPQTVWEYCIAGRYPHLTYFSKENHEDKRIAMLALQKMELEHLSHRTITELSGGEKRRLDIATLLTQTPTIYLLDEPTNHLDVRHQIRVLSHFRYLAERESKSVMLSLHDINLAQQFCNRFLLLFPDGETIRGPINMTLTKENLSRLYQHPMSSIIEDASLFWHPLVNV